MNRPSATDLKYRGDIDGLRALAILPVVMFHLFPALMPGGFIGVDIFFVISGYLISSIILVGLKDGNFTFASFYARRIRRIFPALIVVMGACLIFGWFALLPDEFKSLGKYVLGGSLFADNVLLWSEAGYFDGAVQLKPLAHLWSLGIEEQFYLLYPVVLWGAWRTRLNLLAVIAVLLAVSFALNVVLVGHAQVAVFNLLPTRLWELAAGGVLACLQARSDRSILSVRHENVVAAAGLALVLFALFVIDRDRAFPGWWALAPVTGTMLLIAAGPGAWINTHILANPHAVFIGRISYPLYLWHWPLVSFATIIEAQVPSLQICTIILALSFALAYATFELIERPIRFRPTVATPLVTTTLVATLCGLSVAAAFIGALVLDGRIAARAAGGIHDRSAALFQWDPALYATEDCRKFVGNPALRYCQRSAQALPDVAVIGDSHANNFYPGLANAYRAFSKTVLSLGAPGCPPFYDVIVTQSDIDLSYCTDSMNFTLNFAVATPSIKTIVLVTRSAYEMSGAGFGEFIRRPQKEIKSAGAPDWLSRQAMFAAAYRQMLARLVQSGKEIILVADWPEAGFDPKSCIDRRPLRLTARVRTPCAAPRAAIDERNREYRDMMFALQRDFPAVKIFDPLPWLCDASWCYVIKSGELLYADDNHLNLAGSDYLGARFIRAFPPSRP